MITKKHILSFDFLLVFLVCAIAVFGIIIVGSATRININGSSAQFEGQIMWFISGFVLMIITTFIDYRTICRFYIAIYVVNIFFLVLVLLIGSGEGVSRWIFGLQPSEFSKIFMIIFLAKYIDKYSERINEFKILFSIFALTLLPTVLIKIQPSLSASLVTLAIMFVLLFEGNVSKKYIMWSVIIIIVLSTIFFIDLFSENHYILSKILKEYHINRILSALKPDWSDPLYYQTKNSIWAIGSGLLSGKGLYQGSINQLSYLPESHNDFIFSVIGEEFGFIGCVSVIVVMSLIILRCFMIAYKATDNLGRLIASGVGGMFAFQVFVNVSVATGLLPNTGMPLPFVSYGGSSMWINMIATGLVLNVGIRKPKSMFEG